MAMQQQYLFLVVVWKLTGMSTTSGEQRGEAVPDASGRALREVVAASSEKAKEKTIAALGQSYDADMMEVEVANPFAS